MVWSFFGLFSGVGKLALVAGLALLFYGRSGLSRQFPLLRLLSPVARTARSRPARAEVPAARPRPVLGDRLYLFLVVVAAAAVAAWVVTRMVVLAAPPAPG